MKPEALLRKILTDNHYKITAPRMAVFHRLLAADGTLSMRDLNTALADQVDRVSLYRVIDLYERLGIVQRVTIGWKYQIELSDVFLDHHHHISCASCGKVVAIPEDADVERMIDRMGQSSGFTVLSHQLELRGYCPDCQHKRAK